MVLNRYFWTIILGVIFLGLALPSAFAAKPESEPEFTQKPAPLAGLLPLVRNQLILETIQHFNPKLDNIQRSRICSAITNEACRYNFDPFLISSIIAAESSFSPRAVSRCDARGLMQLTDPVIQIMGIMNPFDIYANIRGGIRYLNDLRKIFTRPELILAAYNAGPGRVGRLQRIPNIAETINYVAKVNSFYLRLQNQFQNLVRHTMISWVTFTIAFQVNLSGLPTSFLHQTTPSLPTHFVGGPFANLYEPKKKPFLTKRLTLLTEKQLIELTTVNYACYPFIG